LRWCCLLFSNSLTPVLQLAPVIWVTLIFSMKSGQQRIKSAIIQEGQNGTEIIAVTSDDRKVRTTATYLDRGLVGDLIANDVKFDVRPAKKALCS
jgi:hypothetical protein